MRRALSASWVGACLGLFVAQACGDGGGADACPVGGRDCVCTGGGGCDPGLSCIDGVCLLPGDDTDSASASNSGSNSGTASASASNSASASGDTSAGGQSSASSGTADTTAGDGGPLLDVGRDETGPPASGCTAIDLLFVFDSSLSMIEERQALAATNAFTEIIGALEGINGGGVDYRIGVTDDKDSGFEVPLGWAGPGPWFDSSELDADEMAQAFNGAVGQISGEPPLGCEHVLTSATDLLLNDATGFVRPEALLVLVLLTDVDDYGAYDQPAGNVCGLGCGTQPPYDVIQIAGLLSDDVKGGQEGAVAAIVLGGDPAVNGGLTICQQPGSCGCNGIDCGVFHAEKLYAFAALLGANGYTADLCLVGNTVPAAVEAALTENIDLACMTFEPAG